MSGGIFIGLNNKGLMPSEYSNVGCGMINGYFWDAFGILLEKALSHDAQNILSIITDNRHLSLNDYSFVELDQNQFNIAVKLIRIEIENWTTENLEKWQWMSKEVWQDICEPLIVQDERYDPDFSV